ncbi:PrgI family protein [Candidatus Saccharibacteria bacterium]|nr:PrgI family protein [Candidatus Saccharibacteria bacterium]
MAVYKLIQDIEAEDKILGPLTLRQFIYALITVFFLYLCFVVIKKHVPLLLIVFLPPALFTGFFAAPFGRDQPTEVWAVAKIGFLFKPRKRLWDQSGVKELVTITVPKKIERVYTNGLSQTEVKSRLSALANTIDTRGWAIKNMNVNLYTQPGYINEDSSDRLVTMSSLPQAVPDDGVHAADDMLDETNNPIAQQFTQMISASSQAHRKELIDKMNSAVVAEQPPVQQNTAANQWFTGRNYGEQQTQQQAPVAPQVIEPINAYAPAPAAPAMPTAEEIQLFEHIKEEHDSQDNNVNSHLRTIQPLSAAPLQQPGPGPAAIQAQPTLPVVLTPAQAAPTPQPSLVNQSLARRDDFDIATLARQAQKSNLRDGDEGEVVISLR